MPVGAVEAFERDLQHQFGLYGAHRAEAIDRVVPDEAVEVAQLLVGEAEIGLAHRHQLIAVPEREGEVGVIARPLAVAALRVKQHGIHQHRVALPLVPVALDPAGKVGAVTALDHDALDHGLGRGFAQGGKLVPCREIEQGRKVDTRRVAAIRQPLQRRASVGEGQGAQVLPVPQQQVIGPQGRRVRLQHRGTYRLAVQALLQVAERGDIAAAPHEQFAVDRALEIERVEQVGKAGRDVLSGPCIKAPLACLDRGLHADPVPLPLGREIRGVELAQLVEIGRGRQHHRPERRTCGVDGLLAAFEPGEQVFVWRGEAVPELFDLLDRNAAEFRQRQPGQPGRHADAQPAGGELEVGISR